MRRSPNLVGVMPALRQNTTATVWLRILRMKREAKCHESLAHTAFMLYLPTSWEKTLSIFWRFSESHL